ncbi:MAG: translation elongation factor 4 [Candidatus Vogelbacteria bacterium]|nr:translation elongation factor 4 [Candidatus Vogelbacteria bacterium]
MDLKHIRNFSIIAHIDHGKSTLADRLLEITGTVAKRQMKEQYLDMMELERERGITIKMQPVRMKWKVKGEEHELNLIDTPGHIDFSYEVSRALKAVEGVILLVDATQGVQAQTFTVLAMARESGLTIIPVLNKIDLPMARVEESRAEMVKLLNCDPDDVLAVSGKTGAGAEELLAEIIKKVPPPKSDYLDTDSLRSLVFDFEYSTHRGIIVYVRVLDGVIKKGDQLVFSAEREKFIVQEIGIFSPLKEPTDKLSAGEIGYLVTGIKERGQARVGETITKTIHSLPAIAGYMLPRPVVWASVYPESQDDFAMLKQSLERLNLQDAALSFEEEYSGALGRGFRCGFLGMLHLEIITERLRREFNLDLIVTTPTISYEVIDKKTEKSEIAYSPHLFPKDTKDKVIKEPWVRVKIMTPQIYMGAIMTLLYDHEATIIGTQNFGDDRTAFDIEMPLRELMRNFFDEVKSVSSGFASLSYEIGEKKEADVVRLDVLLNEEIMAAFSRIVPRRRAEREAEEMADKLKEFLPRQMINIKIQVEGMGRIIASRSLSALKKDVTGYLYGGDITRKMKLREKQKKGKKKMQAHGKVNVPHEVFLKIMKGN